MNSFGQHALRFKALFAREFYVIRKSLRASLIDTSSLATTLILLFGFLLPHMGVATTMIGPLYIGSLILTLFTQNSSLMFRLQADIAYSNFIYYQMGLPLPKRWIILKYWLRALMQTFFVSFPTLMVGLVILASRMPNLAIKPGQFILFYILTLLMISSLFLATTFLYDLDWSRANAWRRRFDPLLFLSSAFFSLDALYQFSPRLTYLFLCNPVTHAIESIRASLLDYPTSVPLWTSALILLITIVANCYLINIGIKRRLDPV